MLKAAAADSEQRASADHGALLRSTVRSVAARRDPRRSRARRSSRISIGLEAGTSHHLGPLRAFAGEKSIELLGRGRPDFGADPLHRGRRFGRHQALLCAVEPGTIAGGVPAGADHADVGQRDIVGTPLSIMVGMSGRSGLRTSLDQASARSRPSRISDIAPPMSPKNISTWPPITPVMASAAPL